MEDLSRPDDTPLRFGTEAFYASIGRAFVVMCAVAPVLFLIHVVDWVLLVDLALAGGVRPRRLDGIDGVLFAPFLHASFPHVYANSIPLILLGTFVLASGVRRCLWSTAFIVLVSGVGIWLIGDAGTVHVGASGVIFGYLGLLLTRGVVERSWWNAAVALLVGVLYGWQVQGVLPGQDSGVSWEGHLFGFAAGILAAIVFRRRQGKRVTTEPTLPPLPPDFTLPR